MKTVCVWVLLLAVTSSTLGSSLKQRLREWAGQHGYHRLIERRSQKKGNALLQTIPARHPGVQVLTGDKNAAPAPPKSFDWREKGVISPVKNQGELGSAEAIAAAECVESLNAIKTALLESLSAPEVQDCCGQLADQVFDCIHNIGGLCTVYTYPVSTGHCRNASCPPAVQIQGGKTVPRNDVMQMTEALLVRPLMVLFDASQMSFQEYVSGVYSDPKCSKDRVDHAMQVVGYGEENGQEYWICKNSWGELWGEQGYIRVIKGKDMCGIESFASYPY